MNIFYIAIAGIAAYYLLGKQKSAEVVQKGAEFISKGADKLKEKAGEIKEREEEKDSINRGYGLKEQRVAKIFPDGRPNPNYKRRRKLAGFGLDLPEKETKGMSRISGFSGEESPDDVM